MGNTLGITDTKSSWEIYINLGTNVEYNIYSTEENYIVKHTGIETKMKYHVDHNTGSMKYISPTETISAGLDGNLCILRKTLSSILNKLAPIAQVKTEIVSLVLGEKVEWKVTIDLGTGVIYNIVNSEEIFVTKITGYGQKMKYRVNPFTGNMIFVQPETNEEIDAGIDGNLQTLQDMLKVLISKIAPLSCNSSELGETY